MQIRTTTNYDIEGDIPSVTKHKELSSGGPKIAIHQTDYATGGFCVEMTPNCTLALSIRMAEAAKEMGAEMPEGEF